MAGTVSRPGPFQLSAFSFSAFAWWPTARSVHNAGAGHGPIALAGAAAQRARPHLIHRAGRQTGERDGARLRGERGRCPCAGAGADLHLVSHRVGYRREMHIQLGGDVIVYARDGRRVQLRLRAVGAGRLVTGGEQHRQVRPGNRLHIEGVGIQTFKRERQRGFFTRRLGGPGIHRVRDGRLQRDHARGHVHPLRGIGRHRRRQRDRRFGKRRIARHAFDDPAEDGNHHGWVRLFVSETDRVKFCIVHCLICSHDGYYYYAARQ